MDGIRIKESVPFAAVHKKLRGRSHRPNQAREIHFLAQDRIADLFGASSYIPRPSKIKRPDLIPESGRFVVEFPKAAVTKLLPVLRKIRLQIAIQVYNRKSPEMAKA
jgi:hypothetical protein